MTVGGQANNGTIDSALTNLAVGIREIMRSATDLSTQVNSQGNGTAYLGSIGYSTVPSASNPGGQSDAAYAVQLIAYMNTIAGVYYGTVQQGGTGGTGATTFNFNNALSAVWAGR